MAQLIFSLFILALFATTTTTITPHAHPALPASPHPPTQMTSCPPLQLPLQRKPLPPPLPPPWTSPSTHHQFWKLSSGPTTKPLHPPPESPPPPRWAHLQKDKKKPVLRVDSSQPHDITRPFQMQCAGNFCKVISNLPKDIKLSWSERGPVLDSVKIKSYLPNFEEEP